MLPDTLYMPGSYIFRILIHVILLSLCLFVIFFPLYRQTAFSPEGTYYTRLHGKLSDYYSYISYIRQGKVQWFQTNQYAIEDTVPRWTHAYYLLLGRIGNWFHASPFDLYYFGILSSFLLFYFYTVKLVNFIFPLWYRLPAMVLVLFCGPFPPVWGISIGPELTIASVWWTKMDQHARLSLVPHHFIGIACLVGATYYFLRYLQDRHWRWVWWCLGIISIGTIFFSVPGFIFFVAVSCFALLLALKYLHRKSAVTATLLLGCIIILFGTFTAQWGMYHIYRSAQTAWIDPMAWEYETHRAETFPALFSVYFLSFGLLLPLLPFSLIGTIRKRSRVFMVIWLLFIIPLLLYQASVHGLLHVNKLRFVYSAPYVFAGILATHGIQILFGHIASAAARRVAWCLLILVIALNIFAGFSAYWWPLTQKGKEYKNMFIPQENIEAMNYLDTYVPAYTPVMTNWFTGAYVPAFSFMKVYTGHEFSTPDFKEREQTADRFYRGHMTEEEAKQLLERHGMVYVLWDIYPPVEAYSSFLRPVFGKKNVILYKVE